MKPHTALVIQAAFGFGSCDEFTNLLRVPVIVYSTRHSEDHGDGAANVAPEDTEMVADTLGGLSELVAMGMAPEPGKDDLRPWAAGMIVELRRLLDAAENALGADHDEFAEAAEELMDAAKRYAIGIRGWEAAAPLEPEP